MNISSFQSEFNKIMGRDYFTSDVKPIREQAFNNFLEKGLPNKNWEDWRYTDLKPIKEINNPIINEITILAARRARRGTNSLAPINK